MRLQVLLGELLFEVLETNEIGKVFRKYSFSAQDKIDPHCLLRVCFILSRLEALFCLGSDFLTAFEGFHFLADIEGLLVGSTHVAEHG
jgi:hypothetical protein